MRTCVNGITRFNDDGRFNNSFHLSRKGMDPRQFEPSVRAWHARIQGVRFVCQDYAETVSAASPGDFVYLDPPYAGNRQRYIHNLDLDRFFGVLESLNRRGARWALSFDGRAAEGLYVRSAARHVPASSVAFQRQFGGRKGAQRPGRTRRGIPLPKLLIGL